MAKKKEAENYLEKIPVKSIKQYEKDLLAHIANSHSDIADSIKNEKVLSPETEEKLRKVLSEFSDSFEA